MSCRWMETPPASTARLMMASSNGPRNMPGNRVRTSMRMTRLPASPLLPTSGRVLTRFAAQELQGVGQDGQDDGEVLAHAAGAARQVDDEGAAADAGDGTAEHGHRRGLEARGA